MATVASNSKSKKELNFELNLMPVIDILTVCICFMLMTVVWMQVGALQAAQSMGGQPKTAAPNPASVWAHMNPRGEVVLTLRDVPTKERFAREIRLNGVSGNVDWNSLTGTID